MKVCCRCKIEKPLTDFAKSSCKKDGHTYACKLCIETGRKERLAADPERAQRLREADAKRKRENGEKIRAKIKERKQSDPEYAARLESYRKKYVENNVEKELRRGREYRQSITSDDVRREKHAEYMREWTRKNSERLNAAKRLRLMNDPEYASKVREQGRKKYARDPYSHRNIRLKSTYGITLTEYMTMYDNQGGKCAICGTHHPDHGKDGLVVDHCHKEGHIRKLLCSQCNKGIGNFRENADFLRNAIEYVNTNERG